MIFKFSYLITHHLIYHINWHTCPLPIIVGPCCSHIATTVAVIRKFVLTFSVCLLWIYDECYSSYPRSVLHVGTAASSFKLTMHLGYILHYYLNTTLMVHHFKNWSLCYLHSLYNIMITWLVKFIDAGFLVLRYAWSPHSKTDTVLVIIHVQEGCLHA